MAINSIGSNLSPIAAPVKKPTDSGREATRPTLPVPVQKNATVNYSADAAAAFDATQGRNRSIYDQPDASAEQAIHTYKQISNGDKIEQLREMLGVDIYA